MVEALRRYLVPRGPPLGPPAAHVTHLDMGDFGGRFHVESDPASYSTFLDVLCAALDEGAPLGMIELRPTPYRFFVDLDLERHPSDNASCRAIFDNAVRALTVEPALCTICFEDGKLGMHLYFPSLLVYDVPTALRLSETLIDHLIVHLPLPCKADGVPLAPTPWEDAVDRSVYLRNGLRMFGMTKRGRRRRYSFYAAHPPAYAETLDTSEHALLRTLSIYEKNSVFRPPPPLVSQPSSSSLSFVKAASAFVTRLFGVHVVDAKGGAGHLFFLHTDCHDCPNKGAAHRSSTIYFLCSPEWVQMRCFSTKGDCRAWRSNRFYFTDANLSPLPSPL